MGLAVIGAALQEKDCWAMLIAGDDVSGIKTAHSYTGSYTSGPQPNIALSWYLRSLPLDFIHKSSIDLGLEENTDMTPFENEVENGADVENDRSTSISSDRDASDIDFSYGGSRLYLFDDNEFLFSDENLIESQMNFETSARICGTSPPLLYGCGRQLL